MINPYHPSFLEDSNARGEVRPARDSLWMYVFACAATLTTTATFILVAAVSLQKSVDKLVYVVIAILACLLVVCVIGLCFRVPSIAIATMVPLSVAWFLTTTGGGAPSTLHGFLFTLPFLVPYIGHKFRERRRTVLPPKWPKYRTSPRLHPSGDQVH
jgi:hypothetical protein